MARVPFNIMMALRGTQAGLGIIVLGLTGYVSNWWANYWRDMSPAEINFLVFASVWTLLSLTYVVIAPLKFPQFAHKWAMLGADALTMTFWFGGFVALAVFLSARVCFGNVCNVARAAVAFSAFEWLAFAATTGYTAMYALRGQRLLREPKEEPDMAASAPNV